MAGGLNLRADAIRRLAKVAVFGSVLRSTFKKAVMLPASVADSDLRGYLISRARARAGQYHPSRWAKSTMFKDALNLGAGQGIKLVLQGIYFLLIARSLGPSQYGAFIAITAMTGHYFALCWFGVWKPVPEERAVGEAYGAALLGKWACFDAAYRRDYFSSAACGVASVAPWIPCHSCRGDLLVGPASDARHRPCIVWLRRLGKDEKDRGAEYGDEPASRRRDRRAGRVVSSCIDRAVDLGVSAYRGHWRGICATARQCVVGETAALFCKALVEDAREGCFFSMSTSAQTIYNDIDKTMLAHLSSLSATGVYGAAYRIIDTSLTPVRALVSAAYPQFFRLGAGGLDATYGYAKRLIRKAVIFGGLDFVALMVLAPLLPHILGPKYAAVAPAVRWLALIPVMRCVHWFLADALSGANAQGLRTMVQVGGGGVEYRAEPADSSALVVGGCGMDKSCLRRGLVGGYLRDPALEVKCGGGKCERACPCA